MINIQGLTITKEEHTIFKDLNYTFEHGKSYALMGYSGSGKSTLLNSIAGFEKIDSGHIYLNGKKLIADNHFYKTQLGYLFQNYGLIDNLSVDENLDIGLAFQKHSKAEKRKRKNILLTELNVNVDLKRKISTLSGGEQQRIALIRLLLKNPNIILADEPTGSLDRKNGEKILDKLLACLNDNKIIIIATHDIDVAKKCHVVVNMDDLNGSLFNNPDTL